MKILTLLSVFMVSCANDPITSKRTNGMNVDFLFENEGCKMYRFIDAGYFHYYSNCNGTVMQNVPHGKVSVPEEIKTTSN